jgi:hypothetical protein
MGPATSKKSSVKYIPLSDEALAQYQPDGYTYLRGIVWAALLETDRKIIEQ